MLAHLKDLSVTWPLFAFGVTEVVRAVPTWASDCVGLVKYLIKRADQAIKVAFENSEDKYLTGSHFALFLEIERWMTTVLETPAAKEVMDGDYDWPRKWLCVACDGNDPVYVRAALPRVLQVVGILSQMELPSIIGLPKIGNPIDAKVVGAFRNLRSWFGLTDDPQRLPFD
jgi:hypothetical protein